jgi:hypothetical protein
MTSAIESAGDPIPADCEVIEVRVGELQQLYNAIDPTPFRERDLDPSVEEFIVGWTREVPRERRLGLLVRLDRPLSRSEDAVLLRESVHQYFARRGLSTRRGLRGLFRRGRLSLAIGLAALAALTGLGQLVTRWLGDVGLGAVVRESLLIGGWVAMWRPMEVFLYDWWPISAEAKLFDRLAAMPVRVEWHPAY